VQAQVVIQRHQTQMAVVVVVVKYCKQQFIWLLQLTQLMLGQAVQEVALT
jgi:hypothetical protein